MRPTRDEEMLAHAIVTASRGTCSRRKVGAVLVDERGVILGTGRNGNARGEVHCTDHPCPGTGLRSGTGLDLCEAIHAEQNALIHCADVRAIRTLYVTVSPCVSCCKLLLNTPCERIVFLEEYAITHGSRRLWRGTNRTWVLQPPTLYLDHLKGLLLV